MGVPKGTGLKLNKDMFDRLIEARKQSRVFDNQIAIKCGIDPSTLRRWLEKGLAENAEEPFKSFAEEWIKWSIKDEEEAVALLLKGTMPHISSTKWERPGDWRAAAWYLERKFPLRWNAARQPDGGPKESFDVEKLMGAMAEQHQSIVELLKQPPPELEAALLEAKDELTKFFSTVSEPIPATTAWVRDDNMKDSKIKKEP